MTDEHEAMIEGQIDLEAIQGFQVFIWKGNDYPCSSNAPTFEREPAIGPNSISKEAHVVIRKSLFNGGNGPFPDSQDLGSFRGITYKIGKVQTDSTNTALILWLESETRHSG